MTEEESHDTSHSTSMESAGEEKPESVQNPVDIQKTKLYHTLSPWKKVLYSLKEFSLWYILWIAFSGALIGCYFILVNSPMDSSYTFYKGEDPVSVLLSSIVLSISLFVLAFTLLDCALYYTSGWLMDKVDLLTLTMYYANCMSTILSGLTVSTAAVLWLKFKEIDYKLKKSHTASLEQVLTTCVLSLFLITIKDFFVRKVKMGFNHTNYLQRIQRCLLEHQFIKTLEVVKKRIKGIKKGKKKRYWMFSQSSHNRHSDDETAEDTPTNEAAEGSTDKYFKPKPLTLSDSTTGLRQKMIIFKEFDKIMNTKLYYIEKGINLSNDTKQASQAKAEKIAYWLAADKKKFLVRHLKKYVDSEYVDHITQFLGLQETQPLVEKDIAALIEKTKREKFAVKKSLVQMEKALVRVSRFVTAAILVFSSTALLSTAVISNDIVKGILGTFFGLGFIFQTSVKNAIDSVIFLFIVHPYDIGDRIKVEIEHEELNMVVSELNVFSTVFYQWDGAKIYIPNHVLLQKYIINVRRSGLMAENITFQISFDTPPEKIQHLKTEISKFIKKHPKEFSSYFMFNYHGIEDTNKLHLKIYLQHAMNWQNYEAYLQRKAKFIMFLKQAIAEERIEYYLPTQRVEILKDTPPPTYPIPQPPPCIDPPQPPTN
ncbi:mechanosensitive ion channel protein 4/5/6/7/8/9/10 [Nematocida sp. AWRm80]|nr:mechanosensitive ion channel protein 4/5/6/7/8/9/10 [Nematocida sp. AWRm80]